MTTQRLSPIVAASIITGHLAGVGLVLGPVAGAPEYLITATSLLAVASGWSLLAALSWLWTDRPQWWACVPAGCFGAVGVGLLVFTPRDAVLDTLGWIWPPALLALVVWMAGHVRHQPHRRLRACRLYPWLGLYGMCAVGGGYETLRASMDRETYRAPGPLVDVGGHRLYLSCTGSGSPTVLLESGLGESSTYWAWIAPAVARETQVCVYDRAGRGWSEAAPGPQDGVGVATDLHTLLDRADVRGPLVLVGHSSGAQYVRIFAGRYPAQVAGVVLLDAQPARAMTRLPAYPAFYRTFRRVLAVLPVLARLGVGRVIARAGTSGLPPQARDLQRASHASAQYHGSLRDEFAQLPVALAQADAVRTLGDRPLIAVTAVRDAQPGWQPLQDELMQLSTNSVHRTLQNATHTSLIEDAQDARASSQAIRDVVESVRQRRALANR